jgi:hypothetical protein
MALLAIGCARDGGTLTRSTAPTTRPPSRVIFKGQRWRDAEAVARGAGYRLNDARGLEWASAGPEGDVGVDGFYVALPGDTILIAFLDRERNRVDQLVLQGNVSQPKSLRTYPPVGESIELPARDAPAILD